MFHLQHQAGACEPSGTATARRGQLPRFLWVVAVLLGAALLFGAARFPVLAATGTPTLKVVPKNVGIPGDGINCTGPHNGAFTWICHVTLTELKSSSKPLHWYTRSDQPARFTPANGNLSPGRSVQVTIATNACGGFTNFYFVGPKNVATVIYQCG
jgi:hypothetical protein